MKLSFILCGLRSRWPHQDVRSPEEEEVFGECAAVSTGGKGSCFLSPQGSESQARDWSDRHGEVSPAHSLGGPLQEQLPASEGSSEDGRDGPHPRVRGGAGVSSSSSNIL